MVDSINTSNSSINSYKGKEANSDEESVSASNLKYSSSEDISSPVYEVYGAPEPEPINEVYGAPEPEPINEVYGAPEPEPINEVYGAPEPETPEPIYAVYDAPEPSFSSEETGLVKGIRQWMMNFFGFGQN